MKNIKFILANVVIKSFTNEYCNNVAITNNTKLLIGPAADIGIESL